MIYNRPSGIIALTTVLIVGAVVLVASLGIAFRSVTETQITMTHEESNYARSLATACMEQALMSLANNAAYAGNETVMIDEDSCIIHPVGTVGSTRVLKTQATYGDHTRRLEVVVSQTTPPLQVSSWEEVTSF